MIRKLIRLLGLLSFGGSIMFAQTQTYTGSIKDLTGAVVTQGKITFTLTPSTHSTQSGTVRFAATPVPCGISATGNALFIDDVSACTVPSNLAINPTGTSYRNCIQPQFATPGSCFFDYALGGTKDISTVAPTLSTGPVNYVNTHGPTGAQEPGGVGCGAGNCIITIPADSQTSIPPSATGLNINMPSSTGISYGHPAFGVNVVDSGPGTFTTGCGGQAPAGIGNVAPVASICGQFSGSATAASLYTLNTYLAGYTGFAAGVGLNAVANRGSSPQQLFHNILLADNSGWDIISISRVANIATATLNVTRAPNTNKVGFGVYISGNTSFNTGAGIAIVTAVTSNTVSWGSPGANLGPVSGGVLAPNHAVWGLEVNMFNNNHDPTAITPTSGQNNALYHGITATGCCGSFPISDAFFANGSYYEGFLSQGAIDADFVAGYPLAGQTGGGTDRGFVARPLNVGFTANSFPSKKLVFTDSLDNGAGGGVERSYTVQLVPAGARNSTLAFTDPSGNNYINFAINQIQVGSGNAAAPSFSSPGNTNAGFYVASSGNADISVNGIERVVVSSSGLEAIGAKFTGSLINSTGMQIATAKGCTFAAGAIGNKCNTSVTLPVTEPDTAYKISGCTDDSPASGPVAMASTGGKTPAGFSVWIVAMDALATGGGTINCLVTH